MEKEKSRDNAKFVFHVADIDDLVFATVSDKEYFDKEGCCSDWHVSEESPVFCSLGLGEEAEGMFTSYEEDITVDEMRDLLNGSTLLYECPKLAEFLNNLS